MNRILAALLRTGPTPRSGPSDRDHEMGTCRWCLNIVAHSSVGWVHLATGHATCIDPPMGAPLSSSALPLPPAPHRWDLLFPADTSRARIAWTLGIIGGTDRTVTALRSTASPSRGPWRARNAQPDRSWPATRPLPPSANATTDGA
jgi:hypothetical protein